MATSKIKKHLSVRTVTVSGTTDGNGFLNTNLKTAECVVLEAKSLQVNGSNQTAYFMEYLSNAGDNGIEYGLRFKAWDGYVHTGTLSATIVIGE